MTRFRDMPDEKRYPWRYERYGVGLTTSYLPSMSRRGQHRQMSEPRAYRGRRVRVIHRPQTPKRDSALRMLDRCELIRQSLDKGKDAKREPTTDQLTDRLHEIGHEVYRLGWMSKPQWARFRWYLAKYEDELRGGDAADAEEGPRT